MVVQPVVEEWVQQAGVELRSLTAQRRQCRRDCALKATVTFRSAPARMGVVEGVEVEVEG